jgi:hypothetical protein
MKIATDTNGCGMSVGGKDFKVSIQELIKERKFKKIVETGTFLGKGTTKMILDALQEHSPEYSMVSIEVNPEYFEQAVVNLQGNKISLVNGLSVPKNLLPTEEDIEELIENSRNEDIFVDHKEEERLVLYLNETKFDVEDDCLGWVLSSFNFQPDLVVLDSAGHMGFVEFEYVLSLLEGPCVFVLDDVYHIKHNRSLKMMQQDKRFNILKLSPEKFGFVIAEYLWK